MKQLLREGLEKNDLARLVHNELHIDEFKSKLGDDRDVIVVSFKVGGKEPANDIVNFVEKGYEWVIDADVSSGEMGDGDFIVFVELAREKSAVNQILDMMNDVMNLTGQDSDEWRVRYYQDQRDHSLDEQSLNRLIPLSPEAYDKRFDKKEIDSLKTAAGVKVDTTAPKNEFTESLRIAAGIL
jgi:hypothetical protein